MNQPKKSALGLGKISKLSSLLEVKSAADGQPLHIDVGHIDEDPKNARTIFDESALAEMAKTIKERGVKTPISVRHGDNGRYVLNHGARRLRASKLAGRDTIPAHVDDDYTPADQLIENIQRENLTALEVAGACQRLRDEGDSMAQIATKIGKSTAYVSMHMALLKLPPVLDDAFRSGRVAGILEINELMRAYKDDPVYVEKWLANLEQPVTRQSVQALREAIKAVAQAEPATVPIDALRGDDGPGRLSDPLGSMGGGAGDGGGERKPKERDRLTVKPGDDVGDSVATARDRSHEEPGPVATDADHDDAASDDGGQDGEPIALQAAYVRLPAEGESCRALIEGWSDAAREEATEWLRLRYDAGRKAKQLGRAVIAGLRNGQFDTAGPRAFALAAFLQGAEGGVKFTLEDILGAVKQVRSEADL